MSLSLIIIPLEIVRILLYTYRVSRDERPKLHECIYK
jgi:hypothetical protein